MKEGKRLSKWHFIKIRDRGLRNVDPSEGIHFEKLPPIGAVIRESAQNSLDAADGNGPVHMRISLHIGDQAMPRLKANKYLNGLFEHLNAAGTSNLPSIEEDMPYVVVEDFNTQGLIGDPNIFFDDGNVEEKNHFYWFHRNTNRTQAQSKRGGSFGYGKASFALASKLKSFFTVSKSGDGSMKVFGNSISKGHQINTSNYQPYGDYGFEETDQHGGIGILPNQEKKFFKEICKDFKLSRGEENGLSVIIPFPEREYTIEEIIESMIRNYFLPICQGKLTVEVVGNHSVQINSETIESVTKRMSWSTDIAGAMAKSTPACMNGMVELASWWSKGQEAFDLETLSDSREPHWTKSLIQDGTYESMRSKLDSGNPLAVRVTLPIFKKDVNGKRERYSDKSTFVILLRKQESYGGSDAVWIRRYLSVPKKEYIPKKSGLIAIVIAAEGPLEQLLRDSEEVAHTEHMISRVEKKYHYAGPVVRFFRSSASHLIEYLQENKNVLETDWLDDWFPSEEVEQEINNKPKKKKKRRKKNTKEIPEEIVIGPSAPTEDLSNNHSWEIQKMNSGFRIIGDFSHKLAYIFAVKIGYARDDGSDPLKKWKSFDFELSDDNIEIKLDKVKLRKAEKNVLVFSVEGPVEEYSIDVIGFDDQRDLHVYAKPVMVRSEEII